MKYVIPLHTNLKSEDQINQKPLSSPVHVTKTANWWFRSCKVYWNLVGGFFLLLFRIFSHFLPLLAKITG